LKQLSQIIA